MAQEDVIVVTRDCGDVPVAVRQAIKNMLEQELAARGTPGTVVLATLGITFRLLPRPTEKAR